MKSILSNGKPDRKSDPVRAAVRELRELGFAVCRVSKREKKPIDRNWPERSREPDDFGPGDLVGVVGGPLSDAGRDGYATVILDLDSADAVAKADEVLPPTAMIEGRRGKPRSHRYYRVPLRTIPTWAFSTARQAAAAAEKAKGHPGPCTKSFRHRGTKAEVLKFVGTGGQVVCPPSPHPSGEVREWEGGKPGEPAVVAFTELWERACRLAEGCGAGPPGGSGWPWAGRTKPRPAADRGGAAAPAGADPGAVIDRAAAHLAGCPPAVSGRGGHDVTYRAACELVHGFDLDPETAFRLLKKDYNPRCEPPWSDAELRHKVEDAARATDHARPRGHLRDAAAGARYYVSGGSIHRREPTRAGPVGIPLCNFEAWIVGQTTRDDGAEQVRSLIVAGRTAGGSPLPPVDVPADEFPGMNWVMPRWGIRAVVSAGQGARDHLRAAIQELSRDAPERTVYGHTGWREVAGGWGFLHAGGAIGPRGTLPGVEVDPGGTLAGVLLPEPPTGSGLVAAVRASLGLLDGNLAPDRVMFPLWAAPYRAALGGVDFGLHLFGRTGVFKSELAALCQQHFGAGMDRLHLPANWMSTPNALEAQAFAAKDALLTIDDFNPTGAADPQKLHAAADRVFRGLGNNAGRNRMAADLSLRPPRPPRALILSTGEDVPRGHSLRARVPVIEVSPGDVGVGRLTACQRDARGGAYAGAMAGYVRWLAPQYAGVRRRLADERAAARDPFTAAAPHARTPEAAADLMVGLGYAVRFAREIGAVTAAEADRLLGRGRDALAALCAEQSDHLQAADPTDRFLRLVPALLLSGQAHLSGPDGGPPDPADGCGWRRDGAEWRPGGARIGWADGATVYLDPEAAFAAAQRMAADQREPITMSARTLWRRLHERNLLARVDARGGRTRFAARATLGGERVEVLHFARRTLFPGYGSVPGGPPDADPGEDRAVAGATPGDTRAGPPAGCPGECPTADPPNDGRSGAVGHTGHSTDGDGQGQSPARSGDVPFYPPSRQRRRFQL